MDFPWTRPAESGFISEWVTNITKELPTSTNIFQKAESFLCETFNSQRDCIWKNKEIAFAATALVGAGTLFLLMRCCWNRCHKFKVTPPAPAKRPEPAKSAVNARVPTSPNPAAVANQSATKVPATPSDNNQTAQTPKSASPGTASAAAVVPQEAPKPSSPQVNATLNSSLDRAVLKVSTPDIETPPMSPKITMLVDNSTSMEGTDASIQIDGKTIACTRTDEVVHNCYYLTESLRDRLNTSPPEANAWISLLAFTDTTQTISKIAPIIRSKEHPRRGQLLKPGGSTEILQGLTAASEIFKQMADQVRGGANIFLLFTDGDQELRGNEPELQSFKDTLAQCNGKLFVVGIGAGHNKRTMGQLSSAGGVRSRFRGGTYIDTTNGGTIRQAIDAALEQAKPSFHFSLKSNLPARKWSVNNTRVERSIAIGHLPVRHTFYKVIDIHSREFDNPLDLKPVELTLTVEDPAGTVSRIKLSWNPNTIIDPNILNFRDRGIIDDSKTESKAARPAAKPVAAQAVAYQGASAGAGAGPGPSYAGALVPAGRQ